MSNHKIDDMYWMRISDEVAKASTCRKDIGTILVKNNRIVSIGFLGSVSGDSHCNDSECLFVENNGMIGTENIGKSCIGTVHSEMNAIFNGSRVFGESLATECYTTYQPCLECLKALLAVGVRKIVCRYASKGVWRDKFMLHTKVVFQMYTISDKI